MTKPLRIAVLASGSGSNLDRIFQLARAGQLHVNPVLAASNVPGCGAMQKATRLGVPVWEHTHMGMSREAFDHMLITELRRHKVDLVVLAGYMRLLGLDMIREYPQRIINLHPALLPSFPGAHGADDAVYYGVRISGCTAHFVEESMDSGPIIIQAAVPSHAHDTAAHLLSRIHAMEHRIFPQAIQWLAQGRLELRGRQVCLQPRQTALSPSITSHASAAQSPQPINGPHLEQYLISPPLEDF